jgi:ferric-dicitrate binding protein FerR (iron transport regulator)
MLSSASNAPIPPPADEQRRRGRRVALVILAFCAAPTVAAWFAYFVWQPQSRTNYGELIAPRALSDPALHRLDGSAFRLSQLRGKWMLLQIDSAACSEDCREKLLYMRQARLAQGRDAERIERVWLLDDDAIPDTSLLREHEGLQVARAPHGTFLGEFPSSGNSTGYIYVVDPRGILMLRFPGNPDARKMLKDLARLLRASRIG